MKFYRGSRLLVAALAVLLAFALLASGCSKSEPKKEEQKPATTEQKPAAEQKPQGDGSLDRVKKAGKLVFATDSTYPPMEYEENGKIIGFDMDVAAEVARRLGVKFEAVSAKWDGLLPGLKEKKYDAVISTMNVTDERKKEVDFASYTALDQVFVVRPDSQPVKKLEELVGKVVAVQVGTTSEDMAKAVKGVKEIKSFDQFDTTFVELKNKKADVIVVDEPVGLYFAKKDPKTFVVSGQAAQAEPVGIAIRKEDKELREAIEKAVDAMKKDGKFKEISMTWFGKDLTNVK